MTWELAEKLVAAFACVMLVVCLVMLGVWCYAMVTGRSAVTINIP